MPQRAHRRRPWTLSPHRHDRRHGAARCAVALMTFAAAAAGAAEIHRCRGADGVVAYQQTPCADDAQREPLPVLPPPSSGLIAAPAPAADSHAEEAPLAALSPPARFAPPSLPQAWQCVAANGEVFYRHDACPTRIVERYPLYLSGWNYTYDRPAVVVSTLPDYVPVDAYRVSLREACRAIERSGDRDGRARDQTFSTYDRNLGRDPCH